MRIQNTSLVLKKLRELMENTHYVSEPLHAYIVFSADAHQNEYLADRDERRRFVSGFTGSAGTAIVTKHNACLWTDGRYFLQASSEMDDNWTLMKEGVVGTPTQGEWLGKTLPVGSRIGVDPLIISYDQWRRLQIDLEPYGQVLIPTTSNLVDLVWDNQPPPPEGLIFPLPVKFTGVTCGQKVTNIREKMAEKGAVVLLVTALDEIAWTLNLRGNDIPFNPVFFSYLLITPSEVHLFVDEAKLSPLVKNHFAEEQLLVIYHSYDKTQTFLNDLVTTDEVKDGRIWISHTSSFLFINSVPDKQRITTISPIPAMKAIKNQVEIDGMINAHIKDAAALCRYFAWLEKEVPKGNVTEISGATKLEKFRTEQKDFMGLSFATISGSGPNGAIIHYNPSDTTDRVLTTNELYLCDSGGQYKDGTTDVTRTWHFGSPTQYEKECYTRVFKGMAAIATALFPEKVKGNVLDTLARKSLWDVGLNYMHGTGHGIGSYLNVHEGPMGISWRPYPDDPGFQTGMFLSDEPGYYEEGKFGIRLENIVRIVDATPVYTMKNVKFLTFETVTLVPIQSSLLLPELLTDKEITFLNEYHNACRENVGLLLKEQGHTDALLWLLRETEPIG